MRIPDRAGWSIQQSAAQAGIILRSNPGVYFSGSDLSARSFDAPASFAGVIPLHPRFKLLLGVRGSILAQYPVLPIGGFISDITPKLAGERRRAWTPAHLLDQRPGVAPLPVPSWSAAPSWGDAEAVRGRSNHTILDYTECRGGAGVKVKLTKGVALDLSGGYDFQRKFNYYRPGVNYRTRDGASYLQVSLGGQF